MTFDDLLDRLYGFDSEVTAYDNLFVFTSYRTRERFIFHNATPNDIQNFIDEYKPILMGYNCKGYDKYILKAILYGCTPEEVKKVNDHIINDGNGWELDLGYIKLPTMWDLFLEIVPRKSLKELEGILCMDITESTVDFNIDHKWTKEEYDEMVYYCSADVNALFPIFDILKDGYEAKYTIATMGDIDPEYALSLTNANLTAVFLKAQKQEHDDKNDYKYPSNFELEKLPKEVKEYFDSFINGDIDIDDVKLPMKIDEMEGVVASGGIHFAINNYYFESEDFKVGDYYE